MSTVLVVDDEAATRTLVQMSLETQRYRVLTVGTGEDALEAVAEHHPDLVVLDLRLPGIDGLEVLERLRDSGRLESLRVVMLSAHASPSTVETAHALGCSAYLTKPFSVRELREVVARLLAP